MTRYDTLLSSRYDQGREDGAVIDDWEDPKLEIYHTQDRSTLTHTLTLTVLSRFGFIHDQRQPSDVRRSDEERKALEKEMNRFTVHLYICSSVYLYSSPFQEKPLFTNLIGLALIIVHWTYINLF